MNSPIEQFYICSSAAQSHLYIIEPQYTLSHFSNLPPNNYTNTEKYIRHCYLVIINSTKQFIRLQDSLYKMAGFKNLNISVTPFSNRQEIEQHIKMMQRMNQSQFEDQYLEMLELVEKQIEINVIKDYCMKELHWSETKFRKFLQSERIDTIPKFLNYRGFNELQKMQVKRLWIFIENLLSSQRAS